MSELDQRVEETLEKYHELTVLLESINHDLKKSIAGNKSAGIRFRKTLREVGKMSKDLSKMSLNIRNLHDTSSEN